MVLAIRRESNESNERGEILEDDTSLESIQILKDRNIVFKASFVFMPQFRREKMRASLILELSGDL